MPITFITGGCRSGKSAFAQNLAEACLAGGHGLFIATAYIADAPSVPRSAGVPGASGSPDVETEDAALMERIRRHREARGPRWRTQEPVFGDALRLPDRLPELAADADVALLDCLTLWVSACMEQEELSPESFSDLCGRLLAALDNLPCPVFLVSNEVGMGLAPMTPEGGRFRDCAGLANQLAAAQSASVVCMISGIPLWLKGKA